MAIAGRYKLTQKGEDLKVFQKLPGGKLTYPVKDDIIELSEAAANHLVSEGLVQEEPTKADVSKPRIPERKVQLVHVQGGEEFAHEGTEEISIVPRVTE